MKYFRRVLFVLIIIAAVVLTLGSWVYFKYSMQGVAPATRVAATLQNTAETLLFNPIVTVEDVNDLLIDSNVVISAYESVLLPAFKGVLAVAPIVDLFIVLSVFDGLATWLLSFSFVITRKRRVLIVGDNDEIDHIIKEKTGGKKIYRWTETLLNEEERRDYLLKRIRVKENDFYLGESKSDYATQIEKMNSFLKHKRITDVVLLDSEDVRNIQYYVALSNCAICSKKTIHFFALINDFERRRFLQNYFDYQLELSGSSKEATHDTHRDLNIFTLQQLNAERAFAQLPLHTGLKTSQDGSKFTCEDVHLLIIGGGYAGEAILLHAMNQGVITSENRILIDVVDKDPSVICQHLRGRFNSGYVIFDEQNQTFSIKDGSDGELIIRLTKADVFDDGFLNVIENLQSEKNGGRFTYHALCLKDANLNLHTFVQLNKSKVLAEQKAPAIIRMSYTKQLQDYLSCPENGVYGIYSDVLLIGENDEYIGLNEIINSDMENKIRQFNMLYNSIEAERVVEPEKKQYQKNADILWNNQPYYRRRSNRGLFLHLHVKSVFGIAGKEDGFWYEGEGENRRKLSMTKKEWGERLVNGNKYPLLLEYAKTEHRRFTYFYASDGWGFTDSDEKNEKEYLHNCLVKWDKLPHRYYVNDLMSLLVDSFE